MFEMIMAYARAAFASVHGDEEGQALVEYALILALVSIASILVLTTLGTQIGTTLTTVTNALAGA
jgi:pilus assembly protein Flp/PilA